MNNLTNEERARIFAMYMPRDVMINNIVKDFTGIDTNLNNPIIVYNKNSITLQDLYFTKEVKLLLTPLSKISDEHAIEVAKIEGVRVAGSEIKNIIPFTRWLSFDSSVRGVAYEYGKDSIEIFFNEYGFWKEIRHRDKFSCLHHNNTFNKSIAVVDRLRELGYALPYKGQSLFDLGIAIDKTTL